MLKCLLPIALVASTAVAQDIKQDVLKLFETKCSECHSPGGRKNKKPELHKGINLDALRRDTNYVKAGDAQTSVIHQRVSLPDGDDNRMPETDGNAGNKNFRERLSVKEVALLAQWINGGTAAATPGAAPVRQRRFIDDRDEVTAAFRDLRSLPEDDRPFIRYLSIANLYNQRDAKGSSLISDEGLEVIRRGVDKLLNSLSSEAEIHLTKRIGNTHVLLRFDLRDSGWTASDWKKIESFYPYMLDQESFEERQLKEMAGAQFPRIRADWFVFATSQPPLYHTLLKLPGDSTKDIADAEVEESLGVDVNANLRTGNTRRFGFRDSGVSTGKRLLERHAQTNNSRAGAYYWKSYDFNSLKESLDGHNLFTAPLGPKGAGLSEDFEFLHDGGEMIWTLPNGLQAYLLTTDSGKRLDVGPTDIVQDSSHPKGRIINGISCASCHKEGLKTPKLGPIDQVLAASRGLDLSAHQRDLMNRLFKGKLSIAELLAKDNVVFATALKKLGLSPTDSDEPIRLIYDRFLAPITARTLQSEMGTNQDIVQALAASDDGEMRTLAANLKDGVFIDRKFFADKFHKIVVKLQLGETRDPPKLAPVEFSVDGKVVPVVETKGNADRGKTTHAILVPSKDYPTIQSALDAARTGEQVLVMPGTYRENLVIRRGVHLAGIDRDRVFIQPNPTYSNANLTVLASGGSVRHITFSGPANAPVRVPTAMVGVSFETDNLVVKSVDEAGPAALAGIRAGMQITHVDGVRLTHNSQLFYLVGLKKSGSIKIQVLTRGGAQSFTVVPNLTRSRSGDAIAILNVTVELKNLSIMDYSGYGITAHGSLEWSGDDVVSVRNRSGMMVSSVASLSNFELSANVRDGLIVEGKGRVGVSDSSCQNNGGSGVRVIGAAIALRNTTILGNRNGSIAQEGSARVDAR